jgi:hypothetical protein
MIKKITQFKHAYSIAFFTLGFALLNLSTVHISQNKVDLLSPSARRPGQSASSYTPEVVPDR